MRRVVLELSGPGFERFKQSTPFRNVKSLEILHLLKVDIKEIAAVCRIEFLNRALEIDDLLAGNSGYFPFEVQVLDKEKDGTLLVFIRGKPRLDLPPLSLIQKGGYISSPFEIRDGKARVTFLGKNSNQVKEFLRRVGKTGFKYRILSLTDARFSPESPLQGLTLKQLQALNAAFDLGYYSVPRRISSEALAEKLGLAPSTLNIHLRKAELHILSKVFFEQ
jgi:hypothetical protein